MAFLVSLFVCIKRRTNDRILSIFSFKAKYLSPNGLLKKPDLLRISPINNHIESHQTIFFDMYSFICILFFFKFNGSIVADENRET